MTSGRAVHTAARLWKRGIMALAIAGAVLTAIGVSLRLVPRSSPAAGAAAEVAVAVEVAEVRRGTITLVRVFSGSIESPAASTVASKIAGRLRTVEVNTGDQVTRGDLVATIEPDELQQLVLQARADVAVATARVAEAESVAENSQKAYERQQQLHGEGVVSDAALDASRAEALSDRAAVDVARAQLGRAESELRAAELALGYASIRAEWTTGDDRRLVAERFAEEGETVSPGTAIASIVELDPVLTVVNIPERDYPRLAIGQDVVVTVDAYPSRTWTGRIERIAPVFREDSRLARVEVAVPNADLALRPGMFARATAVLERVEGATIIPVEAVTKREGREVIFVVEGERVRMRPVTLGIREGDRVQVLSGETGLRVVTLGQQFLRDGSLVVVADANDGAGVIAAGSGR